MRNRSNSGVRLDYFHRIVYKTILMHQNPVTGLLPPTTDTTHAWVRDNVYSVMAIWGLAMAYKKNADLDEDRAKAYELEQSCVKLMRGLLTSMMLQRDKVEKFKKSLSTKDALHAKYSALDLKTVVGDNEWGHLQIDATSIFLLILAQMTASGFQIVFNLDEVALVQNLVFYIESAYCTPDYGIWERGDKTNHGLPELNASSIGMAKAALEAMDELDLFGARGGSASVIHVLADESQKCQAILESMLPRESNSKEVDASLLSVISYPAFAVTNIELIKLTRDTIVEKLQGRYGCKRFLRDGYKTAKEDSNRLYYEPWELRIFENVECEWPLFFCYLIIDACFQQDREMMEEYKEALEEIMLKSEDGFKIVPELYSVPEDKINEEYKEPHSQDRIPLGKCPFMWAQSLYILGKLLEEGFLAPGELDPLNRRLGSEKKPDVVVQVVILATDEEIREKLPQLDIEIQTFAEVAPIEVHPATVLSSIYTFLGKNEKLGLSGRRSKDVGMLSTSKLYALQDRKFAFTPQFSDTQRFYIASDTDLLLDTFMNEIAFLKSNWHMLGRPTVILPISEHILEDGKIPPAFMSTVKKLKSGYINGTRVNLGKLEEFISTSCIASLNFLNSHEDGYPESINPYIQEELEKEFHKVFISRQRISVSASAFAQPKRRAKLSRRTSVAGVIRRSRSFKVQDSGDPYSPLRRIASPNHPLTGQELLPPYQFESPPESEGLRTRSPSPSREIRDDDWTPVLSSRILSDAQYENVDIDELVNTLKETDSLEEQGDILHYLGVTKGMNWITTLDGINQITVKEMLKDLYDKACREKSWALVRHSAGMLGKRVEDLDKAVTDLLVHQKQVTIGMPPYNEKTISHPLPINELRELIHQVYGNDECTAMLTQELIVYLAMFIRTEPKLFNEMIRLRVGLIIQVMASELADTLKCPGTEASEYLLNLSPFEMKNLLHHIISGKEFGIHSARSGRSGTFSIVSSRKSSRIRKSTAGTLGVAGIQEAIIEEDGTPDRFGQWIRRRRLDGSLNRVPPGFYPKIWLLLERCQGLSISNKIVPQSLTQEMTSGELKFALQIETVLNAIPQPEFRQLVVEELMVLSMAVEYDIVKSLGNIVYIENLVYKANEIFLNDQLKINGTATECCATPSGEKSSHCNGAAGICIHFYDSAPSGCYGTMTYMIRATASTLETLPRSGEIDCAVS
uniref:Phosphorylase b kinase regulatory subunit n=1 Tax=Hemiscolopendra marginata TaxID=943146 RepID=A0A646QCY3_9MYRI